MDKIATENLFLLEFLVDYVKLDKQCTCDSPGETCVSFQFLDNAPLDICEADFAPNRSYGKEDDAIKSGKSCLFSLSPHQAEEAINKFDVLVSVFRKMDPGWLPEKVDVGNALISIANLFGDLIESVLTSDGISPSAKTLKDVFDISNSAGMVIGKISVYIRMSCFGKLIVTQFQMNLDDRSVLFKDKEGKSLYRYKKASKRPPSTDFGPTASSQPSSVQPFQTNATCPQVPCPRMSSGASPLSTPTAQNTSCPQTPCIRFPPRGGGGPTSGSSGYGYGVRGDTTDEIEDVHKSGIGVGAGARGGICQNPRCPVQLETGGRGPKTIDAGDAMMRMGPHPGTALGVPMDFMHSAMPQPNMMPMSYGVPMQNEMFYPCQECGGLVPGPCGQPHQAAGGAAPNAPLCPLPPYPNSGNYQEIGAAMGNNSLTIRVHKDKNKIEQIDEGAINDDCPCNEQAFEMRPGVSQGNKNLPFSFKMGRCGENTNSSDNKNIIVNPPISTAPDGTQFTEFSDPNKEMFVLRIGKKSEGVDKKANLELELCTPKGPDLKPIPKKETRDTQYDPKDAGPEIKGKKGKKDKAQGKGGKGKGKGKKGKKK